MYTTLKSLGKHVIQTNPSKRERQRETERDRERGRERLFLLSGFRPVPTGVNIQAFRILVDPMTDLNTVF